MLITYGEYKELGYSGVGKKEFSRLEARAELTVGKFTFGRVGSGNMTEANKRGVCELVRFYKETETRGRLTGFSNEGYSESYAAPQNDNARAAEIMGLYFTPEQLYRGVDSANV